MQPLKNISSSSTLQSSTTRKSSRKCASICKTRVSSHKNFWTSQEDQKVKDAISKYNIEHPEQLFPEDPYSDQSQVPYFGDIKKKYLSNLNRTAKQIRERWVNHLNPKVYAKLEKEEDKILILNFSKQYPSKWAFIAKEIYRIFNREHYYSENTIKNYYHQNKKHEATKGKKSIARSDQHIVPVLSEKNFLENEGKQQECNTKKRKRMEESDTINDYCESSDCDSITPEVNKPASLPLEKEESFGNLINSFSDYPSNADFDELFPYE